MHARELTFPSKVQLYFTVGCIPNAKVRRVLESAISARNRKKLCHAYFGHKKAESVVVAVVVRGGQALFMLSSGGQFLRRQFGKFFGNRKISFRIKFPDFLPISHRLPGPANWSTFANRKISTKLEFFFQIGKRLGLRN